MNTNKSALYSLREAASLLEKFALEFDESHITCTKKSIFDQCIGMHVIVKTADHNYYYGFLKSVENTAVILGDALKIETKDSALFYLSEFFDPILSDILSDFDFLPERIILNCSEISLCKEKVTSYVAKYIEEKFK